MIQRPASGTLDLELCKPTHTGEKSFAVTASEFFQHLQIPFALFFRQAIKSPALGEAWISAWQLCRSGERVPLFNGFVGCRLVLSNRVLLLLYEVRNAGFVFIYICVELIALVLIFKLVWDAGLIAVMRGLG
ncbi:hypothetical protein [Pseudomonas veronii]|uniref:hypothetical protein n=1 Tax=Pseudomonas veronii TaxID=76761 RepID=UPI001D12E711|nr:hypothetical protein [Pseudomonas veronii]